MSQMSQPVVLRVGEESRLKTGKDRIVYGGMPSDNVYSIVQMKRSGNQGFAWNLYFSKSKSEIIVDGVNIYVENVTPDEIRLRVA